MPRPPDHRLVLALGDLSAEVVHVVQPDRDAAPGTPHGRDAQSFSLLTAETSATVTESRGCTEGRPAGETVVEMLAGRLGEMFSDRNPVTQRLVDLAEPLLPTTAGVARQRASSVEGGARE